MLHKKASRWLDVWFPLSQVTPLAPAIRRCPLTCTTAWWYAAWCTLLPHGSTGASMTRRARACVEIRAVSSIVWIKSKLPSPHPPTAMLNTPETKISCIISFWLSLLAITSAVDAKCPSCPPTVKWGFDFKLTNQTSGDCFYTAPYNLFGFECAYWVCLSILSVLQEW